MKWISVDERLPEEEVDLIVWVIYDGHEEGVFTQSWYEPGRGCNGQDWAMGSAQDYRVTHWMYIEDPTP